MARQKSGPKTIYRRDQASSVRLSDLALRIYASAAERTGTSAGEVMEQLARTHGPGFTRDQFPADEATT